MTLEQINSFIAGIADRLGCGYAYYPAEDETVIKTPYLLFLMDENADFFADNTNYSEIVKLAIEYDTGERDIAGEKAIESMLAEAEITYRKMTATIEGQHVHETMYEMEVLIDAD